MNKTLKYSLFLLVLGILAGGLLAFVNSITAPIINERAKEEATRSLKENFDYADYSLNLVDNLVDEEDKDAYKNITGIYKAYDENGDLAAVIYQTQFMGYENEIVTQISINPDGTFENLVVVTKTNEPTHQSGTVNEHDFNLGGNTNSPTYDVISKATSTTSAVSKGIDAASKHFNSIKNSLGGVTND